MVKALYLTSYRCGVRTNLVEMSTFVVCLRMKLVIQDFESSVVSE
jgi:hypothetical protein